MLIEHSGGQFVVCVDYCFRWFGSCRFSF